MVFKLGKLREDPPIRDVDDVFLRLGGDLRLFVDGRYIFEEQDVPLVELANQLHRWVTTDLRAERDFSYDSLESEFPGLIWFRRVDGGWRVGSRQSADAAALVTTQEVVGAITEFRSELERRAKEELQRGLADLIESRDFWRQR